MFTSILILFLFPFLGNFKAKSNKFVKLSQFFFWLFVSDVILLGWLGSCLVEEPYVIVSQLAAIFYFFYFLFVLPFLSFLEKKATVSL
jgi:ubiquinol-cytochrome c reductase cytochrome b subunit